MTGMRLKVVMLLTTLLIFPYSPYSWAAVAIAPAYIETIFSQGKATGQFLITNTGDKEERYRIKATHFTFDANGSLDTIPADANSIASLIKFNPKEFSLPPKSKKTIRFVIIAGDAKAAAREYWGAMELISLETNLIKQQGAAGRSMSIKIIPAILVPIFVTSGDVTNQASLSDLKITLGEAGLTAEALVSNQGQGHLLIEGAYQLLDSANAVIEEGRLGRDYILPESVRRFSNVIKVSPPKGDYTLKVEYTAPQLEAPISQSIKCTL